MANLWDRIITGFPKSAANIAYLALPDPTSELKTIKERENYFRIWLSQMYIETAQKWFIDRYPMVNAQVTVNFGGQNRASFSRIAAPPTQSLTTGTFMNYALTELMPFQGGLVEVTAGLTSMPGQNGWETAIKVLERFTSLVTPPLGQTLAVAQQVTTAMSEFLSDPAGDPILGYHDTFSASGGGGGNGFAPGYLAVIRAPANRFPAAKLTVVGNVLHTLAADGSSSPLKGVDFMLLRVEARAERDDLFLRNIDEPFKQALDALIKGRPKEAEALERTAVAAAILSPDLTAPDARRVVKEMRSQLDHLRTLGYNAVNQLSAEDVAKKARIGAASQSLQQAALEGPITFEEAFAT